MPVFVTMHFIMKVFEYMIYLSFIFLAAHRMYMGITTIQERKSYRTRVQKQIVVKREELIKKSETTSFAQKLDSAGNPLSFTAFKFQILRYLLHIAATVYYVIVPSMVEGHFAFIPLGLVIVLFVATSPALTISITNIALNKVISIHNRKKHIELFTLFDMLKAELKSLNHSQHVNVYHLLNDNLPYFDSINKGIVKFLRFWKTDPEKAKTAFAAEIGGDHAEQLANILFKLDETSKKYAIEVIDGASKVFSTDYFESMNRRTEGKSITFNVLFFGVNILTLVWLIVMVVTMFSSTFDNTNFNVGGL